MNTNLLNASREFGLGVQSASVDRPDETDESLGVWDGKDFVFMVKSGSMWLNLARLVWRYGLAPLWTQNLMKKIVGRFLNLYEEPLFPFHSLSEATAAVDLPNVTAATGSEFLQANGISSRFSREIIQASTRVNYGQNLPLIHGLETMVCMATDGAVSVEGGNWQIFDAAVRASKAEVRLDTAVTGIARDDDGTLRVTSKTGSDLNVSEYDEDVFDEVIIAGPLQYSGISISPPLKHIPDEIPFVKLHVTLLASPHRISPEFFNRQKSNEIPESILTTLPEDLDLGSSPKGVGPAGFWSVSTLRTVNRTIVKDGQDQEEQHYVYKIFSPERPTAEFVADIFGIEWSRDEASISAPQGNTTIGDLPRSEISWFYEKVWHPYPLLYPRVTFEEILLAPGIWYTSGIESFISTMETSALMGRNVANLVVRSWQNQKDEKDARHSSGRSEL